MWEIVWKDAEYASVLSGDGIEVIGICGAFKKHVCRFLWLIMFSEKKG